MRAYVINWARSPARRTHMHPELAKAGIDYEMVEAVDGALAEWLRTQPTSRRWDRTPRRRQPRRQGADPKGRERTNV